MLETVRGAVRRLQTISNCALNVIVIIVVIIIIIIIIFIIITIIIIIYHTMRPSRQPTEKTRNAIESFTLFACPNHTLKLAVVNPIPTK